LASDPEKLSNFLSDDINSSQFQRNYELISFKKWSDDERSELTSSSPSQSWKDVKDVFEDYGFKSITKEGLWKKFTKTFDQLWG
jgi:hypothetical protein